MKNRKNNWIKIVIQLLSFILIPELFVTGFTAIGDIFSQIYAGSISWESVRYSVYVLIATVPGSVLVGRFFCGFFCSFGAVHNIINLRLDITHLYYPAKNSFQKGRLKRREIFTELLLYTLTT